MRVKKEMYFNVICGGLSHFLQDLVCLGCHPSKYTSGPILILIDCVISQEQDPRWYDSQYLNKRMNSPPMSPTEQINAMKSKKSEIQCLWGPGPSDTGGWSWHSRQASSQGLHSSLWKPQHTACSYSPSWIAEPFVRDGWDLNQIRPEMHPVDWYQKEVSGWKVIKYD